MLRLSSGALETAGAPGSSFSGCFGSSAGFSAGSDSSGSAGSSAAAPCADFSGSADAPASPFSASFSAESITDLISSSSAFFSSLSGAETGFLFFLFKVLPSFLYICACALPAHFKLLCIDRLAHFVHPLPAQKLGIARNARMRCVPIDIECEFRHLRFRMRKTVKCAVDIIGQIGQCIALITNPIRIRPWRSRQRRIQYADAPTHVNHLPCGKLHQLARRVMIRCY